MRSPVQPRGGHTALPNELLARALGELTTDQFRLLIGLFYAAEFKREGSTAGRWRVGFGEVLVSYDGLAEQYGMSREAIRRALRRFKAFGINHGRAKLATPSVTQSDTPPDTSADTSPTIVNLGKWSDFLGSERQSDTPTDTSADTFTDTQADPIQHRNTRTPNTKHFEQASDLGLTAGTAPAAGSLARSLEEHQGSTHDQNTSKAAAGAQGDAPTPRKLVVLDSTEIRDTTAAEAQAAVEIALGRRLKVAAAGQEKAAEARWTALVKKACEVDPDGWQAKLVQVCELANTRCQGAQSRRGEPVSGAETLAYFLGPVADALAVAQPARQHPSRVKQAMASCPTWGQLLEYLQAHLRPDLTARWFAPLFGRMDGADLVLEAPDGFHADFLNDCYRPWLLEKGPRIAGITGTIRIEAKAQLQEAIA